MNWKTVALSALRWKVLLLGACGGVWGSLLHETALLLSGLGEGAPLLAGAALGLGLGLWLAPVDALLRQFFRRAALTAVAGAVLGAAGGALGAVAQAALLYGASALPHGASPVLDGASTLGAGALWLSPALLSGAGLVLTLGLIGAGSGLAAGLAERRMLGRGLLGLLAGALLAVPAVAALEATAARTAHAAPWVALGALLAWAAPLALALHWAEKRRARRWLRLLTGPGEDELFPLAGRSLSLGKHERNDIPLPHFQEIYPYHCELRWAADHYDIVDNEQGGIVMVNYRQVQEHALKPGDLIRVGTALLQYGEAS